MDVQGANVLAVQTPYDISACLFDGAFNEMATNHSAMVYSSIHFEPDLTRRL